MHSLLQSCWYKKKLSVYPDIQIIRCKFIVFGNDTDIEIVS